MKRIDIGPADQVLLLSCGALALVTMKDSEGAMCLVDRDGDHVMDVPRILLEHLPSEHWDQVLRALAREIGSEFACGCERGQEWGEAKIRMDICHILGLNT